MKIAKRLKLLYCLLRRLAGATGIGRAWARRVRAVDKRDRAKGQRFPRLQREPRAGVAHERAVRAVCALCVRALRFRGVCGRGSVQPQGHHTTENLGLIGLNFEGYMKDVRFHISRHNLAIQRQSCII